MVKGVEDVLRVLAIDGWNNGAPEQRVRPTFTDRLQEQIYDLVAAESRDVDELARLLGISSAVLNTHLTLLEMEGYIGVHNQRAVLKS